MRGYYHSRETFGTVDGPGIRYVLFLAGCAMACAFCHNPDTWARGQQIITVEEVLADLTKYRRYYEASGGGITVSGGEPLLQAEFVAALFCACREQAIHTMIDTAGYCSSENIAGVVPYTDAALFCLKVMDAEKHRWLTGVDNKTILGNCRYLAEHIPVTVRYVVIPGVNDDIADIRQLAVFINALAQPIPVELLPYHTMGRAKWDRLGLPYRLTTVSPATEQHLQAVRALLIEQEIRVLYEHAKA